VDEVECWKIRWALADVNPEKDYSTLHATNPVIYSIISILLTMLVSSATSERSVSAMRRVKSYLRSTMSAKRLPKLSLMHIHRHVQVGLGMSIDDFVSRRNRRLDFSYTDTSEKTINNS
jgi:hypothetical protein